MRYETRSATLAVTVETTRNGRSSKGPQLNLLVQPLHALIEPLFHLRDVFWNGGPPPSGLAPVGSSAERFHVFINHSVNGWKREFALPQVLPASGESCAIGPVGQ